MSGLLLPRPVWAHLGVVGNLVVFTVLVATPYRVRPMEDGISFVDTLNAELSEDTH